MVARAKRRLAIGTLAAVGIGAAVVVVFMVASSGSSGRNGTRSASSKEDFGTFGAFGVAYGVRGSQVLRRFGAPDQKRNSCWIYRIHRETFHGIKLGPQLAGVDAVRYCFYSGVLAIIEDHWRPGRYNPQLGPWEAPVTYGCGGGPCEHQGP